MKLNWKVYTWPKLFVPPRRLDVTKIVFAGRRSGKCGLTYHSIVDSLPISTEKKIELHELYEKELRGEEC